MIFRRCGWALAVVYAGVHVAAATELTAPVAVFRTDWGIQLGPITLIPGGFLAFTSLYRERNETADIASSFGSIPFPNNNNYYIKEFRETARDTRVSLLAQGPPGYKYQGEGYLETDFVSAGANSNTVKTLISVTSFRSERSLSYADSRPCDYCKNSPSGRRPLVRTEVYSIA
jgi:hypothetical protein